MEESKIKASINLDGMDELEGLLQKQQEILKELQKNSESIERVRISINFSIEKATS